MSVNLLVANTLPTSSKVQAIIVLDLQKWWVFCRCRYNRQDHDLHECAILNSSLLVPMSGLTRVLFGHPD